MLGKIKDYIKIARNMGFRYTSFRLWYEVKNKTGILKKAFPTLPPDVVSISLKVWRATDIPFFFRSKENLNFPKTRSPILYEQFELYTAGYLKFFNNEQHPIGTDYNWLKNPDSGFVYAPNRHWTEIEDFSTVSGDIKYVWEKSRFSFLYTLIRYDYHFEKDCSDLVFREIESWIDANPINTGPNYKCSQEISLRILNWTFALNYYRNSETLTEIRFNRIIQAIYWQLHHVKQNIDFSRISVRNNHAITECLMLYLSGVLFPFLPNVKEWSAKGKKWFEQEIKYQIYEDGTYLQFSHNYHRVVIQLLTWAFFLAEKNKDYFVSEVYERAKKSLLFLHQNQNDFNGHLPNYGNNDGALFFPLNNCNYRNFKPQLNALFFFFNGCNLYDGPDDWVEDTLWYSNCRQHPNSNTAITVNEIEKKQVAEYAEGGFFTIKDDTTLTTIRCGKYRDRPAQADNLHLDIWVKDENILRDSGTYKYNTTKELQSFFFGTQGHNTVMLGHYDQMLKGAKFIWLNWSQAVFSEIEQTTDCIIFTGKIHAFMHADKNIFHARKVKKYRNKFLWEIEDTMQHETELPMHQLWHTSEHFFPQYNISAADEAGISIESQSLEGFYSGYYGSKESSPYLVFTTKSKKIFTRIEKL